MACWCGSLVGACAIFLFNRTTFGRAVYGIGNRERAAFLSGINTRRIVMLSFVISGALSAFGGVSAGGLRLQSRAIHGRRLSACPPSPPWCWVARMCLGGRGSYGGTVAGVILITLLQSILSVMQIEEAGRQLIFGAVIIIMLLMYGRQRAV